MSTYVPNYQHDVFVSYAPVDDEPLIGAETGWITTLLNGLKVSLNQKLGRRDAFSLWQDTLLEKKSLQLTILPSRSASDKKLSPICRYGAWDAPYLFKSPP
jgi:hypothetical protein